MIRGLLFSGIIFLICCNIAKADTAHDPDFDQILSMDISQLTVISVSKKEEKLSDAAAAVYVISGEDIKRMGATTIPDALRIVPGLQVEQFNSHSWTVSSRGFNSGLNNKLLVLIDGRSVYTPVYAGVYWDDQIVMLEDVDRIEVIRGPGASLYGANAMNGVINIITKKASETQGGYASETVGNVEHHDTDVRYGGKIGDDTYYRIYAKELAFGDSGIQHSQQNNFDAWDRQQAGFRMDTEKKSDDNFTFQGDMYGGNHDELSLVQNSTAPFSMLESRDDADSGANLLGRWTHTVSDTASTSLQIYVDHYDRDEIVLKQNVTTMDADFQNNIALNDRNNFVWGAGYRYDVEDLTGSPSLVFPEGSDKNYDVLNAFLQDEYAIIPNKLFWTLGSKFEYNNFTGFELEPSTRLSWKPTEDQTVWGAISRSVRIPSLIEEDLDALSQTVVIPGIADPVAIHLLGNNNLNPERLISYELGYRIEPSKTVSLDNAIYFNHYDALVNGRLGTAFVNGGELDFPVTITNGGYGNTWGFETSANWRVTPSWQLTAGYSFIKMALNVEGDTTTLDATNTPAPQNQFSIRSYLDLPHNLQFDNTLYYVEEIDTAPPRIPSYFKLDVRLGWKIAPGLEASIIGRNLLEPSHAEYPETPVTAAIDRSFLAKIAYKF